MARLASLPAIAAPVGNDYHVVHGWPVLPDGELVGQTAGVAVDSHGNVLVFHRADRHWREPLNLAAITRPTLILFDGHTGKTLKQWGARAAQRLRRLDTAGRTKIVLLP